MQWKYNQGEESQAEVLCSALGVSLIVARHLVRLGICDPKAAKHFINPRLKDIDDPFRLTNVDRVVSRLCECLRKQESILVFGDYDVDGITSTTFFLSILRFFGVSAKFLVPRRLEEGYGLSRRALERGLKIEKPDLFVAIDCGTNSAEEVAFLLERGIDVIVIDHHTQTAPLPTEALMVNPHVNDGADEPWRELCSVGLVFKVVHALVKHLRLEGDELALSLELRNYLDLVALGTVADLVPLRGENRIFAKAGLRRLQSTVRVGLSALFEVAGMNVGEEVSSFDISFKLGPRINACGRLGDASMPIKLLLSEDSRYCHETVRVLDEFNNQRRLIEQNIFKQADEMIQSRSPESFGYLLYHKEWHPGVVGIVASRVVQKYHKPCLVLGSDGKGIKGSGRSIDGVNLVEVLREIADHFEHWGGHPMAVGVSVHPEQVSELERLFPKAVKKHVEGELPEGSIEICQWIQASDICDDLVDELDCLHPFGKGNPEPTFGIKNLRVNGVPKFFGRKQEHYRFQIACGAREPVDCIAWKQADKVLAFNGQVDIAFKLNWNYWNGRRTIRMTLVDWRQSNGHY